MSGSGPAHSAYEEYLRSAHWRHLRQLKLLDVGERCQVCGARVGQLDVHHTSDEGLGEEQLDDLVVLCSVHHQLFQEADAVEAHVEPEWPWPGRDRPPTQRLCRAGLHWWETVALMYPIARDGRSPTVTRCRRCFTRRGRSGKPGGDPSSGRRAVRLRG
jgi:hypothetical protein